MGIFHFHYYTIEICIVLYLGQISSKCMGIISLNFSFFFHHRNHFKHILKMLQSLSCPKFWTAIPTLVRPIFGPNWEYLRLQQQHEKIVSLVIHRLNVLYLHVIEQNVTLTVFADSDDSTASRQQGIWPDNKLTLFPLVSSNAHHADTRVFPILYLISWISRIRWIQLESVKHDWRLLKAFLCLSLTVGSVV